MHVHIQQNNEAATDFTIGIQGLTQDKLIALMHLINQTSTPVQANILLAFRRSIIHSNLSDDLRKQLIVS